MTTDEGHAAADGDCVFFNHSSFPSDARTARRYPVAVSLTMRSAVSEKAQGDE
jgi:hypothetical protein